MANTANIFRPARNPPEAAECQEGGHNRGTMMLALAPWAPAMATKTYTHMGVTNGPIPIGEANKHYTYYLQCNESQAPQTRPQLLVCDHYPSTVELTRAFRYWTNPVTFRSRRRAAQLVRAAWEHSQSSGYGGGGGGAAGEGSSAGRKNLQTTDIWVKWLRIVLCN